MPDRSPALMPVAFPAFTASFPTSTAPMIVFLPYTPHHIPRLTHYTRNQHYFPFPSPTNSPNNSNSMSSYYDINDVLSEEHETATRVKVAPYIKPNDSAFFTQFLEASVASNNKNNPNASNMVTLPMWITNALQSKDLAILIVPTFFHSNGISNIMNNPHSNLSQYSPYFFHIGYKLLNLYASINQDYRAILVTFLRGIFLRRFREQLSTQADNRGLKSVPLSFLEALPESEHLIFRRLELDFNAFHRWRSTVQQSITVDLPVKRQRKAL